MIYSLPCDSYRNFQSNNLHLLFRGLRLPTKAYEPRDGRCFAYRARSDKPSKARVGLGVFWSGLVGCGKVSMPVKEKNRIVGAIGGESPSNGAAAGIEFQKPYRAEITIEGVAPILFHRWNCESVESKSKAKKGSAEKKSDDVESYVYRTDKGELAIPGEYLRGAVVGAAKYQQDPRSPRKSAMDLFKAGVISLTSLASLGTKDWDLLDKRRVVIQRNAITRSRPCMREGWKATFILQIQLPEYIDPALLNSTIQAAGRLIGLGDFRPSFGRFAVVKFDVLED
jgi:hypothetical protein